MEKYKVIGRVARFGAGARLELTAEQHKPRKDSLSLVKGKIFEVKSPVEFKAGEVIGLEGALDKAMGDILEAINPKEPEKKPEKPAKTLPAAAKPPVKDKKPKPDKKQKEPEKNPDKKPEGDGGKLPSE